MKQILGALLLTAFSLSAFAVPPKQVTVCGVFQVRNSDGMLPVVVKELLVEMPAPMEGFNHYRLSADGMTIPELEKRQKLLNSMRVGEKYCVTGPVSNRDGRLEIQINKVKAW